MLQCIWCCADICYDKPFIALMKMEDQSGICLVCTAVCARVIHHTFNPFWYTQLSNSQRWINTYVQNESTQLLGVAVGHLL